jgi:hypothetical protein
MYSRAADFLASSETRDEATQRLRAAIAPFRAHLRADLHTWLDGYTLDHQAAILIAEIVNAHLPRQRIIATPLLEQSDEHSVYRVATDAKAEYWRAPDCTTLVEFAHHMLALALQRQLPIRLCRGCPRVFVADPPDRLYLDERCGATYRQRARRAKEAQ